MSEQDIMVVRQLHDRAWRQGYGFGYRGMTAYAGDWEHEFRKSYIAGFEAGKADRVKAQGDAA
jgi:hypothetical protein